MAESWLDKLTARTTPRADTLDDAGLNEIISRSAAAMNTHLKANGLSPDEPLNPQFTEAQARSRQSRNDQITVLRQQVLDGIEAAMADFSSNGGNPATLLAAERRKMHTTLEQSRMDPAVLAHFTDAMDKAHQEAGKGRGYTSVLK